jgi:regulator of nucleoside diphosphate kinase
MKQSISLINKLDKERILELFSLGLSPPTEYKKEDFIKDLKKAKVVKPESIPPDLITMRSKFRLKDIGTGDTFEYSLVYPQEVDSDQKISILDSRGRIIFGSRKGQIIHWNLLKGLKYYQIEEILYQPEAFGHWEL